MRTVIFCFEYVKYISYGVISFSTLRSKGSITFAQHQKSFVYNSFKDCYSWVTVWYAWEWHALHVSDVALSWTGHSVDNEIICCVKNEAEFKLLSEWPVVNYQCDLGVIVHEGCVTVYRNISLLIQKYFVTELKVPVWMRKQNEILLITCGTALCVCA